MSTENDIDTLVSQLQGLNKIAEKQNDLVKSIPLKKEQLEDFIIERGGKLIESSTETIEMLKQVVQAAPDSKEVAALAELIKASSSTLDTLTKLIISNNKNNTMKEIKQLDINAKTKTDSVKGNRFTREEIFQQLFGSTVKDATVTNSQPSQQDDHID